MFTITQTGGLDAYLIMEDREKFFLTRIRWLKTVSIEDFRRVFKVSKAQASRVLREIAASSSHVLETSNLYTRLFKRRDDFVTDDSPISKLIDARTGHDILNLISSQSSADIILKSSNSWFPEVTIDDLDMLLPVELDNDVVEKIIQSISNKKVIRFKYVSRTGVKFRNISADRIASIHGKYYLHAFDHEINNWRIFKIARMSEVSDADDLHFISGQHSPSRRRTTIKYKINDDLPDLVKNRLYQEWAHQDGTVTVTTYACWADIISLHMVEAKEIDRDKRMYIPYFTKE